MAKGISKRRILSRRKIAPGIITASVNQPVQTGIIPIDAMIPIGRKRADYRRPLYRENHYLH